MTVVLILTMMCFSAVLVWASCYVLFRNSRTARLLSSICVLVAFTFAIGPIWWVSPIVLLVTVPIILVLDWAYTK
jgi:chromate transport protein ChrA